MVLRASINVLWTAENENEMELLAKEHTTWKKF